MRRNNSRIKSAKAFGSLKLSAPKVIVQLLERSKEAKEYEEGTYAKSTPTHTHAHTHTRARAHANAYSAMRYDGSHGINDAAVSWPVVGGGGLALSYLIFVSQLDQPLYYTAVLTEEGMGNLRRYYYYPSLPESMIIELDIKRAEEQPR
jgi:hypothetical protein